MIFLDYAKKIALLILFFMMFFNSFYLLSEDISPNCNLFKKLLIKELKTKKTLYSDIMLGSHLNKLGKTEKIISYFLPNIYLGIDENTLLLRPNLKKCPNLNQSIGLELSCTSYFDRIVLNSEKILLEFCVHKQKLVSFNVTIFSVSKFENKILGHFVSILNKIPDMKKLRTGKNGDYEGSMLIWNNKEVNYKIALKKGGKHGLSRKDRIFIQVIAKKYDIELPDLNGEKFIRFLKTTSLKPSEKSKVFEDFPSLKAIIEQLKDKNQSEQNQEKKNN